MLYRAGQVIQNRYRIHSLLGQGANRATYRAWDLERNANRVLKHNFDMAAGVAEEFVEAARQLQNIYHPGLPRVLDWFSVHGEGYFLVMEWIDGSDLQTMLEEHNSPLPQLQVLGWMSQVYDALAWLHTRVPPVIHGDIKPKNILITPAGQAMLVDYGICRRQAVLEKPSRAEASAVDVYAAPELQYEAASPLSDLYSLGATLYTVLTGEEPLPATVRMAGTPLTVPRRINPALHGYVEEALLKTLALYPPDRFENTREMKEAFHLPYTRDGKVITAPILPRPVYDPAGMSSRKKLRPAVQKRKRTIGQWLALAASLMVLAGLVFAAVKYWPQQAVKPEPSPTATTRAAAVVATQPSATQLPPTPAPTATITPVPCLKIGQQRTASLTGAIQVCVPAGAFQMGSPYDDAADDEKPVHTVNLDAFWIDRDEVTNGNYAKCVQAGVCILPLDMGSATRASYYDSATFNFYPVVNVPWQSAVDYCTWEGGRLPSEAEWEKAARGTDGRKYPWGNNSPKGDLVNFADKNTAFSWSDPLVDDKRADTAPVGSYPAGASPYGVLDMAGNVMEWTADWYGALFYLKSPGVSPTGPEEGTIRVARGGSWRNAPWGLRTSARAKDLLPENGYNTTGFRCVYSQ